MLESLPSADDLYLAANEGEVEQCRPILTGDVFSAVGIPGIDDVGSAMVLTHPCSMRADGVNLAPKLLMALVGPHEDIPLRMWKGHFGLMPLPNLLGEPHAVYFDQIGLVPTADLAEKTRVACLTPLGINLMQQRYIWYLTRFEVPTFKLNDVCGAVFEEADLCEEWAIERTDTSAGIAEAHLEFHDWIRITDESGSSRQIGLSDPQRRAGIRRTMRQHLKTLNDGH